MKFSKQEFLDCLNELGLSQVEAAKLLSVTPRTLNRWTENPNEISGPAEQALCAWLRLQRYNLPWRPDGVGIADDHPALPEQIANLRNRYMGLDNILKRVLKSGGNKLPWKVDIKRGTAKLETLEIFFYKLSHANFTPTTYRKTDQSPKTQCDQEILEDGFFTIYRAMIKERWINFEFAHLNE